MRAESEDIVKHGFEHDSSKLEARTRALFEQSVKALDGRTRSRLNRARQAALAELRESAAQSRRRMWISASGVAAAAVLAVWMTLSPGNRGAGPNEDGMPIDELDLFAESTNMDLLQDVEFYAWMAAQAPDAPNGNSG